MTCNSHSDQVMGEEPDWSPEDLSEAENNDEVVDDEEVISILFLTYICDGSSESFI